MMKKLLATTISVGIMASFSVPSYAAKTITYSCDGQDILVSFPDKKSAVMVYDNEIIVLKEAKSASGSRYTGEGWQLWEDHDEINLASMTSDEEHKGKVAEDKGRTCKKKS